VPFDPVQATGQVNTCTVSMPVPDAASGSTAQPDTTNGALTTPLAVGASMAMRGGVAVTLKVRVNVVHTPKNVLCARAWT
jgi:hypothetical protein